MRRRKPLKRTPIRRSRKTGKTKERRIKRPGKFKPYLYTKGVTKASPIEWIELRRLKLGPCRVCGALPVGLHHLVGGDDRHDVAENLIPLCGTGSTGCHGIYTSHHRGMSFDGKTRTWAEVADAIRRSLRPEEEAFVIKIKGEYGLERRYPFLKEA